MKAQKNIVLKLNFINFINLMSILLLMAKKLISNQINQIKSRIMRMTWPNKIQNTPKIDNEKDSKPKNVEKTLIMMNIKIV